MKGIAINGHKLHEVQMLLAPYQQGFVSYLRYPKHRIQFEQSVTGIVLRVPPLLAVELEFW